MIDSDKLLEDLIKKMNIIDVSDIPSIDLYMDQVTTFMEKHLKNYKRFEDDKIMTKTMINNYSKNELLPPSNKKRYSKEHLILLIFIYYFKNILTINDIKTTLSPLCDSFFDENNEISLENLYNTISDMEKELLPNIKEDISDKISASKNSFSEAPIKDKNYLQLFYLISSLAFDVYVKKQMLESIVDSLNETSIQNMESSKETKKVKDDKKTKEEKKAKDKKASK